MLHFRLAAAGMLVLLALASHPTSAAHCTSPSTSTTGPDQVVIAAGGAYLVTDTGVGKFGTFVYTESNQIPGLQRADANRNDTCHGIVPADSRRLA